MIITLFAALFLSNFSYAAVNVPEVSASDAAGVAKVKEGMSVFKANCAACHAIDKKLVGPPLAGVWDKWESEEKLISWVHNSQAMIKAGDPYAVKIFKENNNQIMQSFQNLTDDQIRNIFLYVKNAAVVAPPPPPPPPPGEETGSQPWLLYSLLGALVILALLLWNITSKLDSVVKEQTGEPVTAPAKPLSKRLWTLFLVVGSIALIINLGNGAVDLGRSQGYTPDQPIKFSHALHVGQNKIECQYCHTGVEKSKHASIPGTQICMNCHKYVQEGPQYGKEEINKIYAYAGWDPDKQAFVRAPKNIEWVKIHNLPDHVYFNHSQHVVAGKVACQTCHGKVDEYEDMKQFAPLSMGWCINCHRQTEVQFADNKYYSVFEKYHEEIKKGKRGKVTVEDIGGTECQKCHY